MLGKRHKYIRREIASVWLGPARKRFRTHDFSTAQRHDGLIVNHKIAAVNGVQQAIARRLDSSQDPQDKQCRQQAYQDAKRQPEKQLSVPAFSQGVSDAHVTTVNPSSGTGFITYMEPLY